MKLYHSEALRRGQAGQFANAKLSFLALAIGFGALVSPVESETLAAASSLELSYATLGDEDALRDDVPPGVCAMRITDLEDGSRADADTLLNLPAFDLEAPDELINTPMPSCHRVPNA